MQCAKQTPQSFHEFVFSLNYKKVILFGNGGMGNIAKQRFLWLGFRDEDIVFCDNYKKGDGIISPNQLKNIKDIPIIITSSMYDEISKQLDDMGVKYYYFHELLFSNEPFQKFPTDFVKINKIIGNLCKMSDDEKYTVFSSMKAVSELKGDVAEVGTYKGGSAKIICETKKDTMLYLFDTFNGLPTDEKGLRKGWLNDTSLEDVNNYLRSYPNISFHQGDFADTKDYVIDKKFKLVHLDVDLYYSTFICLKFFYPRMVRGGRIIIHDYNAIIGVKEAVLKLIPKSKIIEISTTQVMIIC